jgi:hypothetical protein
MLNFQFPPAGGHSCPNGDEFCLKIEYFDVDCHVCENALYIVIGDGMAWPLVPQGDNGSTEKSSHTTIKQMHLFPNPTANAVTVEMPIGVTDGKVQIYDSFGKLVMEQEISGSSNVINTESLPSGLYSVRYTNGKKQYVNTLMISK